MKIFFDTSNILQFVPSGCNSLIKKFPVAWEINNEVYVRYIFKDETVVSLLIVFKISVVCSVNLNFC